MRLVKRELRFVCRIAKAYQFSHPVVPKMTANLIDFLESGTAANCESYFLAFHPLEDGTHAFVTGRYIDRFACRGGEWKIAQRHVVIDSDSQSIADRKQKYSKPIS